MATPANTTYCELCEKTFLTRNIPKHNLSLKHLSKLAKKNKNPKTPITPVNKIYCEICKVSFLKRNIPKHNLSLKHLGKLAKQEATLITPVDGIVGPTLINQQTKIQFKKSEILLSPLINMPIEEIVIPSTESPESIGVLGVPLDPEGSLAQNFHYKQQKSFDEAKDIAERSMTEGEETNLNPEDFIFVAKDINDRGAKSFSFFKNIKLCNNYIKKIKPINRCFYEQITNNCLEFYDIDSNTEEPFWTKYTNKQIIDIFLQLRTDWGRVNNYENGRIDKNKDVLILESTQPEIKKSIHIVIRNRYMFENIKQHNEYIKVFQDWITNKSITTTSNGENIIKPKLENESKSIYDDLPKNIFDTAVYTTNRCIRTINSTKFGKDRYLERSTHNLISKKCDEELFYITNTIPQGSKKPFHIREYRDIYGRDINVEQKKNFELLIEERNLTGKESKLSSGESKIMFDHLADIRWDNYQTCMSLIWVGKHLLLTDRDIHYYCEKSDKYDNDWVQNIIDQRRETCTYTIATLLYYLKQDVSAETYNNIVPKNNTFDEIKAKEQHKRTKEEENYLNRIMTLIETQNINLLTETTDYIERSEEKYVLVDDINSNNKVIIIKAGLGQGKTTATVKHINKYEYESIIILTPRRSYAKCTLARVNREIKLPSGEKFVLYSDLKGTIMAKFIILQVESIHRFNFNPKLKTLLLLDECESLLYQMTSHSTHGMYHEQNISCFEHMIKQSSKILALDAFISNKTINLFTNMGVDFKYFNYTQVLEKREAIEYPKKEILSNKLIEELELGKKIFFFCSSKKQLTDFFLTNISAQHPNKKIIEYHSKKGTVNTNTDINDEWKDADLIICTCTITVGMNFDIPDIFNSIFVYASACSKNLIRDIFQATYRVRHLIDKQMHFCLDTRHYGMNLTTNPQEINTELNNKVHFHKLQYEKFLKMELNHNTPKWIKELLTDNIFESNMSIMSIEPLFLRYLEMCNYEIIYEDENMLDKLDFDLEDSNLIFEDYQYQDIPEITRSELIILKEKKIKDPLSDRDQFILDKAYFQITLSLYERNKRSMKIEDEITLWNIYSNYGKSKFRNLAYEKGLKCETLRITDIISESFPELADNLSKKLEDIGNITEKFDLKNSQDFGNIKRDVISKNLKWLEQNSARFHTNFNLRNRTTGDFTMKNGSELLNKIFNSWGYSKITRGKRKRKKGVDGKKFDITDYVCSNTQDIEVYKHLEPKCISARDRKVKNYKEGDNIM